MACPLLPSSHDEQQASISVAIRLLLPAALLALLSRAAGRREWFASSSSNGWTATRPARSRSPVKQVEALDGDPVRYDRDADLYLGVTGSWVGGRFDFIRVRDGRFEGRTAEGLTIQAPMDQITAAKVARSEYAKGLLAVGVLLGLLATAGLIFIIQFEPTGGRALRIRGNAVVAPLVISDGWRTPDIRPDISSLSPEARGALAAAWASSARSEHASVPAFSRLSLSLVSLGAPAHLVEAAHRAALEEIEHARLSFALAEAYALTPMGPGPLVELATAGAVTVTSRADLARESLVDGCLLEGAAAAYAQVALARASDPAVRAALAIIARDEASHASWPGRSPAGDAGEPMSICGAECWGSFATSQHQGLPSTSRLDFVRARGARLARHRGLADLFEQTRAEVISRAERDVLAYHNHGASAVSVRLTLRRMKRQMPKVREKAR